MKFDSNYLAAQHRINAFLDRLAPLRSYQDEQAAYVGDAAQELLHETLAHEPGGAGDEHVLVRVELRHGRPSRVARRGA